MTHCPTACFVVEHQRHHVVITGTLEEGTSSFHTTSENGIINQNRPRSLKDLQKDISVQWIFIEKQEGF